MGSVKFLKRIKEKKSDGGLVFGAWVGCKKGQERWAPCGGPGRGDLGLGSGPGKDLLTSALFNVIADAISEDFLRFRRYDRGS